MAPKEPVKPPQNPEPQKNPSGGNAGVQQETPPTVPEAAATEAPPVDETPTRLSLETQAQNEIVNTFEYKSHFKLQQEVEANQKKLFALRTKVPKTEADEAEYKKLLDVQQIVQQDRNRAKARLDQVSKEIKDRVIDGKPPPPKATSVPTNPQQTPANPNNQPVTNNAAANAVQETPEEKKARENREKALKEQLTGEDGAGKLRLGYQTALMLMMDKILQESKKVSGGIDRRDVVYSNFATSRTGNIGHVDFSNSLFKTPDTKVFFNQIPPRILSALVPSVKLYFVVYPDLKDEFQTSDSNQSSRSFSWRIPFDDLPAGFKSTPNESSEFASEPIETILKNEGKMSGCGIKSFQYVYKGTNPSETNSHIEASLELFFQNISLITKEISINENDSRFIDGVPTGLEEKKFAYSHLINGASRYIQSGGKLLSNDQYFRIKAEVGYAEPSSTFIEKLKETTGLKPEEIQSYINAIKSAKISFFLSPITHDISFNEDATVTLKINYQATVDAILSDYNLNIFSISTKDKELKLAEQELRKLLDERQSAINNIKCGRGTPEGNRMALKSKNEEYATKVEKIKTQLDNIKNSSQQEIYRKLLGLDAMPNRKKNPPGVFKVKILNSAVGVDKDGKPISGALQFRLLEGALIRAKGLKDHQRLDLSEIPNKSDNANTPKEGDNSTGKKAREITATDYLIGITSFGAFWPKTDDGKPDATAQTDSEYTTVKYVYLGDIIDIASECLNNVTPNIDRPKIILGEIPINVPTNISSEENDLVVPQDADVIEAVYNIADIPISLDLFDDFYYQKVIKGKKSNYPLLTFIHDIIQDLLIPAINPSAFGKKAAINNKIRVSHFGFLLPYENGQELLLGKTDKEPFNGIITGKRLVDLAGPADKRRTYSQEVSKNGFANYLLIYDSMSAPNIILANNGRIDADESLGIYHFNIGEDSGIVKSISFSKTDIPLAAEARALQEGGKLTNRLRQMYSSEVKLFGNNIFRPGDYIFIDPIFYGVNTQDAIGIGGYYMVTKVNTSISPNNFETVLSCYHQAWVINGRTRTPTAKNNLC